MGRTLLDLPCYIWGSSYYHVLNIRVRKMGHILLTRWETISVSCIVVTIVVGTELNARLRGQRVVVQSAFTGQTLNIELSTAPSVTTRVCVRAVSCRSYFKFWWTYLVVYSVSNLHPPGFLCVKCIISCS